MHELGLKCLKDLQKGEGSYNVLCRRALDLVYALVNENNIKPLTKELLEYLRVSDTEFKPDLVAKICQLVQQFAPDKRWHFDSILQVSFKSFQSKDSQLVLLKHF